MKQKISIGSGFTVLDFLFALAITAILGILFISVLARAKIPIVESNCASNLKQISLAFRIWESDNNDHYPQFIYTNQLGYPLYADAGQQFHYFQVMSNEIFNPKVLVCPQDKSRVAATNFTFDLNDTHISYFIGLDADETRPTAILAGDDNLTNGTPLQGCLLNLATNQPTAWNHGRHSDGGNVALSDGSVQQFNDAELQQALLKTGFATNRLLMP